MDVDLHIKGLDFPLFYELAMLCEKNIGGQLTYEYERPTQEMINTFGKEAREIPVAKIPSNIWQSEMENNLGCYYSASGGPIAWNLTIFRHEVLNQPFCSFDLELENTFEKEPLIDLFLSLINTCSPKLAYCYCFEEGMEPFDMAYYSNRFGVWAGLRDIYWLNYYGKEFVDLMGATHLTSIGSAQRGFKVNEGVFVQIQEKFLYNRALVKDEIGKEFFVEKKVNYPDTPSEITGLFAMIRYFWQLMKEDKKRDQEVAPARPKIEEYD